MNRFRRGSLTIELLLLMPVLLALVVGAVEMSLLVASEQKLEAASATGARVAAQGGDQYAVNQAVQDALRHSKLAGAKVIVRLDDENGYPLPTGSTVEVRVQINANQSVPDLLGFIGFSIKKMTLSGHTAMRKE
jgi:Flp pilus assembly protein TadG